MNNELYKRQLDIINPQYVSNTPIHIIGCGGIGSWTTLLLAKMGINNITIYDDDTVEEHNVASQFFKTNQIGQKKTEALQNNVFEQTGIEVLTAPQQIEQEINNGLVIIAVDSMEERFKLYELFKDKNIYIIDARMGGLQLEIYLTQIKEWNKTLINPEDVDKDACTAKSISFNCAVIGGFIANYVRLFLTNNLKDKPKVIKFLFDNIKMLYG